MTTNGGTVNDGVLDEPDSRAATFAAWGSTIAAVTVASFVGGAMSDIPCSRWIRPAAALQVIFAARIVLRRMASACDGD